MTEEKKDVLLRQGNPLTESRYKFSNYEKNAFYVVVKQEGAEYEPLSVDVNLSNTWY